MKIKPSSYVPIFLLLVMLYVLIESLGFEYSDAKVLPLIICSAIFVLAAVQLGKELWSKETKPQAEARSGFRPLGLALGWVVGFSLGIYLLGFYIAIPLFVFFYLKMHKRGWLKGTGFAAIVTAFIYGVFEVGFKFHLYGGVFFS